MKLTFKNVRSLLVGLALATPIFVAHAQVDSTGVFLLKGTPKLPASLAGSGGGATVFPYTLPAGTWVNSAPYPLQVVLSIGQDGWGAITVNGIVADSGGSKNGPTKLVAVIPAGATFTTPRSSYVTALANGASWAQTGITFKLGIEYKATYVPPTPNWQMVKDCRLRYFGGKVNKYGPVSELGRFVVSEATNCALKSIAYFGKLPSFDGNGGTYYADPKVGSFSVNGTVWRSPYMRDVNEGLHYCTGEKFQTFNVGDPLVLGTVSFRVTGASQCTVANVVEVFTCGSIGCSYVPYESY